MEERLQKIIAHAGICSRRKAEELILNGVVKVNKKVVDSLGAKADPQKDKIEVNGKLLHREKKVYILLNKPVGYITSVSDPRGRRTVMELIQGIEERIYPVGRLDYDTSGLLVLTNDGDLALRLTHPSHEVYKTYVAVVKGKVVPGEINKLERGIFLSDGKTAPARVKIIKTGKDQSEVQISIREGKNRQVRRMMEAIDHEVIRLKRTAFDFLDLQGLTLGKWRFLTKQEIERLQEI